MSDPTPTGPKFTLPPVTLTPEQIADAISESDGRYHPPASPQAKVDATVASLNAAAVKVATGSVPAVDPKTDADQPVASGAPVQVGRHLATQTEYPARTAIVHGAGTFLAFLIAIASILGDENVQGFVNTYVPGQAAGVIAFGVFCGLLAGVLSRIANLSKVAALRTRLGLGPIPKKDS